MDKCKVLWALARWTCAQAGVEAQLLSSRRKRARRPRRLLFRIQVRLALARERSQSGHHQAKRAMTRESD